MLATPVLAAGVTHLTDARYFAAWEVDRLAFPLDPALEGAISWDLLAALREWITGPELVVELGAGIDPVVWSAALGEQGIKLALLPASAPAAAPELLHAAGIGTIINLPVAGYQSAEDVAEALAAHPLAESVILDFTAGGITWADLADGHPFGPDALRELLTSRPVLLRIDLAGTPPLSVIEDYPLAGLAVRGSSEEKVGYKSFDDLDDLFEALETFA